MTTTIDQFKGRYWFLSNFYIEADGLTNEHRFQAAKATNEADHDLVLGARGAGMAKRIGGRIALRPGWDEMRLDVMKSLLASKFRDPGLRQQLFATGDAVLIEGNIWNDRFWGVDLTSGVGSNHLGRLLTEHRALVAAGLA
jgi:predicted NAD-dependent protein-ADP-ribosyltransferase YbiA (DUF1768 family)